MNAARVLGVLCVLCAAAIAAPTLTPDLTGLATLWDGETKMQNALWIENPKELQMGNGRTTVTVADLKGPGIITMIHFAMPATLSLDRSVVLRVWWDGEKNPSVDCPLTDFFCDPNGALEQVTTSLTNKRRGWNAYFPMPFAKSARIEMSYDNRHYPAAWQQSPCYSYVMYRALKRLPRGLGQFHAQWRQETLLLGQDDYTVFEAKGRGEFVGWNVTIRGAAAPEAGYPVDENEKFYVDGETEPSIEWQGIEDSFGFSWGFPETQNYFPNMGYQPFCKVGAAAYRFCLNDRIGFKKSIRMVVGFGKNEDKSFRETFSKPENPLQFSSVAYWYQKEPHTPMPPLPASQERLPIFAGGGTGNVAAHRAANETLVLNCGSHANDVEFLEDGWDFSFKQGYAYAEWKTEVNHCWASDKEPLELDIFCPKGAAGMLRLYILDADNFGGGRKESITVAGRLAGNCENFQQGRWIDVPVSATDTSEGNCPVLFTNLREGANVVVSKVVFVKR